MANSRTGMADSRGHGLVAGELAVPAGVGCSGPGRGQLDTVARPESDDLGAVAAQPRHGASPERLSSAAHRCVDAKRTPRPSAAKRSSWRLAQAAPTNAGHARHALNCADVRLSPQR